MIISRIPFTAGTPGEYERRHFLLSVFSAERGGRRQMRAEVLDCTAHSVAEEREFTNPFLCEVFCERWTGARPDLLRAEREALFQRGRHGREAR
jgi:hypothetical protein